jgi:hypothetical protein
MSIKLTIKTLKGEKFQIEVEESRTVEDVKGLIVGVAWAVYCGVGVPISLFLSCYRNLQRQSYPRPA